MTEDEYKPELDEALLADWCAFCEGSAEFDQYHFSTILMGVFVGDLTPEVDDFLRRFSRPFAPALYANLVRICGDALPDRDILPWIRRDLDQKLALLDPDSSERETIERFLATDNFTYTEDFSSLPDIAIASPNFAATYEAECDYIIDHCDDNSKMYALREALYHLATNHALAHSIMSPLLDGTIDLSNYFEIYLRGGDYVVAADSIVVYQGQNTPTA